MCTYIYKSMYICIEKNREKLPSRSCRDDGGWWWLVAGGVGDVGDVDGNRALVVVE